MEYKKQNYKIKLIEFLLFLNETLEQNKNKTQWDETDYPVPYFTLKPYCTLAWTLKTLI